MRNAPLEVEFEDHYGETRTIHRRVGGGLSIKRTSATPILALNAEVSKLIGRRVKALRIERGLTLVELATRIGITSGHPKNRMWQIENPGVRSTTEQYGGMRFGTLYALAIALDVDVCDLLPPVSEVRSVGLGTQTVVALR